MRSVCEPIANTKLRLQSLVVTMLLHCIMGMRVLLTTRQLMMEIYGTNFLLLFVPSKMDSTRPILRFIAASNGFH